MAHAILAVYTIRDISNTLTVVHTDSPDLSIYLSLSCVYVWILYWKGKKKKKRKMAVYGHLKVCPSDLLILGTDLGASSTGILPSSFLTLTTYRSTSLVSLTTPLLRFHPFFFFFSFFLLLFSSPFQRPKIKKIRNKQTNKTLFSGRSKNVESRRKSLKRNRRDMLS